MKPRILLASLLAVSGIASATFAQDSAAEARGVVITFLKAMAAGDEKAAFETLAFNEPADRKEADALLGASLAQRQFEAALKEAFGEAVPHAERAAADIKRWETARIDVTGDDAKIALGEKPVIVLIKKDSKWKIDFGKTQRENTDDDADSDKMVLATAEGKAYRESIAEVKAKTFKSTAEARASFETQLAKAMAPIKEKMAMIAKAKEEIRQLRRALETFEADTDRYPTTVEGLDALAKAPDNLKEKWKGPYLEKIPKDPWGNAYSYKLTNMRSYDMVSNGPDGKQGTDDDVEW